MAGKKSLKIVPYTPHIFCPRCGFNTPGLVSTMCKPGYFRLFGCNAEAFSAEHVHVQCRNCGTQWMMEPKPLLTHHERWV